MKHIAMKNIAILGAGAFGTALSIVLLKKGHRISLIPRRAEQAIQLRLERENKQYLAGIALPNELIIDSAENCLASADIIILAIPVQQAPTLIKSLSSYFSQRTPLIVVSKGILIENTDQTPFLSDWLEFNLPNNPVYVLSGPNFAMEIAQGLPAAATLAHIDAIQAKNMVEILWDTHFRLYPSTDRRGVEFCGAIKNVYAIACGLCVGLNLGQNALASLVTRSLAEMKRLGLAMGASLDTFLGLAGVGDLMLTCTSIQSRNMSYGIELAQGVSPCQIQAKRNSVTEGVATSRALQNIIHQKKIVMPIANAVFDIVHNGFPVEKVISDLLSRQNIYFE